MVFMTVFVKIPKNDNFDCFLGKMVPFGQKMGVNWTVLTGLWLMWSHLV